jgi:drug/metabolite transporter (DMT)-like permease
MPILLPYYAALLSGILLGVMGQIMLKAGALRSAGSSGWIAQFLQPYTIAGFIIYALASIFYIIAIKRLPVSVAFPSVSLSYVIVALLAHFLWNEPFGPPQYFGILLIVGGVLLLNRM